MDLKVPYHYKSQIVVWAFPLSLVMETCHHLCILPAQGFEFVYMGWPLPLDQPVEFLFSAHITGTSSILPR